MKKFFSLLLAGSLLFLFTSQAYAADAAAVKEVVEAVKKAVALVGDEGEAAYPKFYQPENGMLKGSLYVFAFSLEEGNKGVLTAHLKESMVGKSLLGLKEPGTNRKFAQEFVTIAESPSGSGWTEYKWAKPNVREIATKATYIMKVPGKSIAIGAGIYDVTRAEAEKLM